MTTIYSFQPIQEIKILNDPLRYSDPDIREAAHNEFQPPSSPFHTPRKEETHKTEPPPSLSASEGQSVDPSAKWVLNSESSHESSEVCALPEKTVNMVCTS